MDNITNGFIINGKVIELSKEQVAAITEAFANPDTSNQTTKNINLEKDDTNQMAIEFNSHPDNDFYFIDAYEVRHSENPHFGERMINNGNYCHNEDVMIYRMHRETLARLIWRFAMEHNKITLIPKDNPTNCRPCTDVQFMQPNYWNDEAPNYLSDETPREKVSIEYFMDDKAFGLAYRSVEDMSFDVTTTYFDDEVVATRCINEVIIPYIDGHSYWFPEFAECKQLKEYLKNKIPW